MRGCWLLLLLMGLGGCGDDIQFAEPPAAGKKPLQSREMSRTSKSLVARPKAGSPRQDTPRAAPKGAPASLSPTGKSRFFYSGTVKLAPGYKLPATYTVFVAAYPETGRMPALVRRYPHPTFPFSFELTSRETMAGVPPKGKALRLGVILSERGGVLPGGGRYTKQILPGLWPLGKRGIQLTISK